MAKEKKGMNQDKLRDWFLHNVAIGDDTAQRKITDLIGVCLKSASDYDAILKIKNGVERPAEGTQWADGKWLFLNANDKAVLTHIYTQCKINFLSHNSFTGRTFEQVYTGVYPDDKEKTDVSCWCGDSASVIGLCTAAGKRIAVQRTLKKLELMGLIISYKRARTIYRRIPTIREMMGKLDNVAVLYDSSEYPFGWKETQDTDSGTVEMWCKVDPLFDDPLAFRAWVQEHGEDCKVEDMPLPKPIRKTPVGKKTTQQDQSKKAPKERPAPKTTHTGEAKKVEKAPGQHTTEVYKSIEDKLDRLCDGVMDDFL